MNRSRVYSAIKLTAKRWLNAIGLEVRRRRFSHGQVDPLPQKEDSEKMYASGLAPPWSNAYFAYREQRCEAALGDPVLMKRFQDRDVLPADYGVAIDERCIEYPWVLTRIGPRGQRILDAGSALNHRFLLEHAAIDPSFMTIMTLGPESACCWQKGASYVFGDLRSLPFRDGWFDLVVCLSTLEHVGFDNSQFVRDARFKENNPDDFLLAVQEFKRVLRPGSRLLITVPFGHPRDFKTFQLFTPELIVRLVNEFAPKRHEVDFYRYREKGWNLSSQEDCSDAEYEPWVMTPQEQRSSQCPVPPDRATAARAVAYLSLER